MKRKTSHETKHYVFFKETAVGLGRQQEAGLHCLPFRLRNALCFVDKPLKTSGNNRTKLTSYWWGLKLALSGTKPIFVMSQAETFDDS